MKGSGLADSLAAQPMREDHAEEETTTPHGEGRETVLVNHGEG